MILKAFWLGKGYSPGLRIQTKHFTKKLVGILRFQLVLFYGDGVTMLCESSHSGLSHSLRVFLSQCWAIEGDP
jgi:hypothetical protein